MRKIALGLIVLLLVLSSCSGDSGENDTPVTPSTVLVKKIIELDKDGKELSTTDFVYNGNKIVSEVTAKKDLSVVGNIGFLYTYKTEYIYTGNLITSIKVKNIGNSQDKLVLKTDFFYDSNEDLISSTREQYFDTFKAVLRVVYAKINTSGINCKMYSSDSRDNIETLIWEGKFSFDTNKNLVKSESLDASLIFGSFEYDTKSNPKKSILGLDKIVFQEIPPLYNVSALRYHLHRFNNILKSNISGSFPRYNQYTYNANGYPSEMKEFYIYNGNNIHDVTFQYFYE
ncbi:hypothetical protein [Flavobacterium sandaracinum]|uniref:DUF4595 domain-containing protein n=1 Tax=Flavobacterium sandaracinum TaxID=2541733 RepID=A0A4R5CRF4_9FLAO|nr:hypothetical protein [Flavobacterium sandaracinum]TDE02087.1 hypothetical protein E0F91_13445 [Flavobacterium sandaracinum]